MSLRPEQYRTLYAISTLKAPLANIIGQVTGENNARLMRQKLDRLVTAGFVEKSAYGSSRVTFMLSLAGRSLLQSYLASNPKPALEEYKPSTERPSRKLPAGGYTPQPVPHNTALPRQMDWRTGTYDPKKQGDGWRISL